MLKVHGLSHFYGPHAAVQNLTFEVRPGKLVGFLGPNGAGKTTTMKIIAGLTQPQAGEVWVNDIHLGKHPIEAKKKIGYLPEHPPLYQDMTVREYLTFVAEIKLVPQAQTAPRLEETLSLTRLNEVSERPIYRLSKGYRQRVGLAQALVSGADLIILDEPTVGFDPQQVNDFKKLLLQLKGHRTILWSTHILSDVEATCDEIIVINKGQIVAQGSYQEITRTIRGKNRLLLFVKTASPDFTKDVLAVSGIGKVDFQPEALCYTIEYSAGDIPDAILQLALRHKVGVIKMESDSRDLQSLFLELTAAKAPEVQT